MFGKSLVVTSVAALAALALPTFAQDENPSRHEVAVQAFGSFVTSTTQDGIENKATHSGGVLGTYRFFFSRHHGVEGNYGYSRNTQSYGLAAGPLGVKTDSHEVSAAYVFRVPLRRVTPFALAGVGALVFDPVDLTGTGSQTRAAFVYGGGADFEITRRLFARVQYRGFVYNSPTYDLPALANVDRNAHRAEPSVGFGYRF
jgi:opacity protein-like surface antigen